MGNTASSYDKNSPLGSCHCVFCDTLNSKEFTQGGGRKEYRPYTDGDCVAGVGRTTPIKLHVCI